MTGEFLRVCMMRVCLSQSAKNFSRIPTLLNRPTSRAIRARWSSTEAGHKWSTPLAKQLAEAITTTGPIPVASYMRQCLTSDLGGYYTSTAPSDGDQFGAKGDFVTSPEISQVFGELIGIWIVAEWIAQGKIGDGVYLMEVGPGRGTLMDDVLRTIRNFPSLQKAIDAVYLVEASEKLRHAQHSLLCGGAPIQETDIGFQSFSRHSPSVKVIWAEDIRFVPMDERKTPFILAHEFFDALPIHIFQATANSSPQTNTIQTPTGPIRAPSDSKAKHHWRELLVSPKPPHRLADGEPEFELSMSRSTTPHSMYLPETSPRYTKLKDTDGATIEISPESQAYVRDFAVRIGGSNLRSVPEQPDSVTSKNKIAPIDGARHAQKSQASGAALIIDYGQPATIPANSLRGVRSHQRVSPFASAGAVDVSADVDFLALAETALNSSPDIEVHGPVDQARFLTAMGIEERANQLVKKAMDKARSGMAGEDKSELTHLVKRIEGGWKRLIDRSPQGMGRLYHVMAIIPHQPPKLDHPRRRPVGFGGDIGL